MPAFFFSPNYDEYHEYGKRTIAAFLNIRNPKFNPDIKDRGVTNTAGEDAMNELISQGYDGFIRTEDGEWYETNAFFPNQIKSATDNVGTFDEGNEDIRFSVKGFTPEKQEIIAEAKKNGTWMLAPNGKPTNLTEKQWAQVRTKAFKKWFGDWELAAKAIMPRKADIVSEAAALIQPLINKPITNHLLGITATISGNSISKLISEKATKQSVSPRLHAIAVANIDVLFQNATIDIQHADRNNDRNIAMMHRIGAIMFDEVSGEYIPVKITVKEFVNEKNKRIYSVEALDIEKQKKSAGLLVSDSKENGRTPIADFDAKIQKLLETAKDSSKIVDENGEPMVVYHGTTSPKRFSIFNEGMTFHATNINVAAHWSGTTTATRFNPLLQTLNSIDNWEDLESFALNNLDIKIERRDGYTTAEEAKEYGIKEGVTFGYDMKFPGGATSGIGAINGVHNEQEFLDYVKNALTTFAYDATREEKARGRAFTYASFINGRNPLIVDAKGREWYRIPFEGRNITAEDAASIAQQRGYDSVIINNVKETDYADRTTDDVITFNSNQIKSATDNVGTFDEGDEDIRFSVKGFTPEKQEIIAEAKKNGTWMLAPNGKPTNLTEKQWAQVRTKAFKKWFGDWEKVARIEKLRSSKDAVITGNEITPSSDLKEYKKNALEYGKSLRGEYINDDTGDVINLTGGNKRGGIREILQHDYKDIEHLQSIAAIPQIIEKSIFIEELSNDDRANYPNVESFRYYVCGLKIGDVDYTVKSVVAVQTNGARYYDHKLTNIEKGKLLSIVPTIQKAGIDNNLPISGYKDKRLISILQANASKIVDENGEPMVVYHGTMRHNFTAFKNNGSGISLCVFI